MVEHVVKRDRALVAHPRFADNRASDAEYDLDEAVGLAEALGVDPISARIVPIRDIRSSNFFGAGQIEDMGSAIAGEELSLLIVNASLTPVQQRNLERILKVKVIDRTGLILEIFGLRAATKEGRLQVELARLGYERSRLVRTWTHLERQRGGTGGLAGPGETQIESDRRVLNDKMTRLKRKLDDVRRTRGWNKTDLLNEDQARHLSERASASRTYADMIDAFEISCLTGEGIPELERGIEEVLTRNDHVLNVRVTPAFFSARAWLHQNGQVLRDETGEGGVAAMQVRLSESDAGKFLARYKDLIVN